MGLKFRIYGKIRTNHRPAIYRSLTCSTYCVLILLHNLHSFRWGTRVGFLLEIQNDYKMLFTKLAPTASGRGTGAGIYVHILAPSARFQNFHQRTRVFPKSDVSAVPPSRAGLGHYTHLTYIACTRIQGCRA